MKLMRKFTPTCLDKPRALWSNYILLFHDGVTPIRTIDKCDRTDTSQKQLDGNCNNKVELCDTCTALLVM